jgi:acyl carrier protein
MASVADRVRKVIADQLDLDERLVVLPEMEFDGDLGTDALDMVEIEIALEHEFTIRIPDERTFRTVGEAVEYVEGAVLERAGRL